ncbi:3-isopropylmalate dehydrogenase [Natranaerofaba carboxydovora]|uniref:3-isopropylmalate dehydrogenase n=1 Tax=Natranaerofaba carboxydovora TaxID=2742683 RepID=UPI001F140685|nr:3-isopropylmalate dehydrogenase [Natranaerofaba carboxydovora]UMZ75211.1 3-isopropylmalate dehydrogenase [Natranaerofaba carboxydovora]
MNKTYKICILPGDGIGTDIIEEGKKVLQRVAEKSGIKLDLEEGLIGGIAYDKEGTPFPQDTWEKVKDADAVLLGAVGGPKWDCLPRDKKPEKALLELRKGLNVYLNLRPVKIFPFLAGMSPIKNIANGEITPDLVIARELSSGIYYGEPKDQTGSGDNREAVDTMRYTYEEIERITRKAFELAKNRSGKVTSVDKANVLASSGLWRDVVNEISNDYPDVELDHILVDNCAMQVVLNPQDFDVMLCPNMFGDIISDLASVLPGSIGLMPSASLGEGRKGLYEPVHGSAPDIAGQGKANPLATILSVAMLLEMTLGLGDEARTVEKAVYDVLNEGYRTHDLYYDEKKETLVSTQEMGDLITDRIV